MLDARLQAVADFITADCHADIGSDHANLPHALLTSGRVKKIIVVEKTSGPVRNSQRRLSGLNADVRLGDGFCPIKPSEVDSASLCGMGGDLIVRILREFPDRLPKRLVLQPNTNWGGVRTWAFKSAFRVIGERLIVGRMHYPVINLERATNTFNTESSDPAYERMPLEPAIEFGPRIMRSALGDPASPLHSFLQTQLERLESIPVRDDSSQRYLDLVHSALNWLTNAIE
ncbi:MAG TPA: hypothetical protein DDW52_22190 [Planctomycetaceae bacterium]|nr:hypothetical protein [Planctomycetaceae bacterium]